MNYFYLLKSNKKSWFYIGSTKDLKKRIAQHNSGEVSSTKKYIPLELIYYEAYKSYNLANKRELHFKKNRKAKEDLLKRLKEK